jgi:hypothetical protein
VGFNTIEVLLSEDEEMTEIVKFIELNDISAQSVVFDGLKGATQYFYKVSLKNQGSTVIESDLKRVETSYRMESFSLLTEDSYSLSSKLVYLESITGSRPEIIMMHELVSGTLGLIGGSMGAIMALAVNGYEEVLSSVALSPTRDDVFVIFPNMTLSSVYYLVGELDIIPGTSDHGINLLSRDSLNISIIEWFLQTLPMN